MDEMSHPSAPTESDRLLEEFTARLGAEVARGRDRLERIGRAIDAAQQAAALTEQRSANLRSAAARIAQRREQQSDDPLAEVQARVGLVQTRAQLERLHVRQVRDLVRDLAAAAAEVKRVHRDTTTCQGRTRQARPGSVRHSGSRRRTPSRSAGGGDPPGGSDGEPPGVGRLRNRRAVVV